MTDANKNVVLERHEFILKGAQDEREVSYF